MGFMDKLNLIDSIHPDLKPLVYIEGVCPENFSDRMEPSTIYANLLAIAPESFKCTCPPMDFPSYATLMIEQRYEYLQMLTDPFSLKEPFRFQKHLLILYYGLERQMYEGDFEKAFDIILKLKDRYVDLEFDQYADRAIVFTALRKRKYDELRHYIENYMFGSPKCTVNLLILAKGVLGLPFTCRDLMKYRYEFNFRKKLFLPSEAEFESALSKTIKTIVGSADIPIEHLVSITDELPQETVRVYGNSSLTVEAKIPCYSAEPSFKGLCKECFFETCKQFGISL